MALLSYHFNNTGQCTHTHTLSSLPACSTHDRPGLTKKTEINDNPLAFQEDNSTKIPQNYSVQHGLSTSPTQLTLGKYPSRHELLRSTKSVRPRQDPSVRQGITCELARNGLLYLNEHMTRDVDRVVCSEVPKKRTELTLQPTREDQKDHQSQNLPRSR